MIKTITADSAEELDAKVNAFEEVTIYPTGVSRVFATQTHVVRNEGMPNLFVATVFYKK